MVGCERGEGWDKEWGEGGVRGRAIWRGEGGRGAEERRYKGSDDTKCVRWWEKN